MSIGFRQAEAIIRKQSADLAALTVRIEALQHQFQSVVNPTGERASLYKLILKHFDNAELMELCMMFDDCEWSDLPGASRKEKVNELIRFAERMGKMYQLISECQRLRPHVEWPAV